MIMQVVRNWSKHSLKTLQSETEFHEASWGEENVMPMKSITLDVASIALSLSSCRKVVYFGGT
jgi:hypothetical protein